MNTYLAYLSILAIIIALVSLYLSRKYRNEIVPGPQGPRGPKFDRGRDGTCPGQCSNESQ